MIQLSFLGSMAEVGSSGILVDTGIEKIVLDYGANVDEVPPRPPMKVENCDYVLLTHAHLDHCGSLPYLVARGTSCPIYALDATKDLTELLLNDSLKINLETIGSMEGANLPFTESDVKQTLNNFKKVTYRKPFKLKKTEVTYYDAGHIPGSAMSLLKFKNSSLLYTGNYNTLDTKLLEKADEDLPKVDYLITESTYSDRDHPDRMRQEKELVKIVEETIANNGTAIISSFAVGRSQEILLILEKYGINYPVYIDGMAKKATTIINHHKNLLKEPNRIDEVLKEVKFVLSEQTRKKIVKQPCVVITTSGMLSGGPVISYIKKLHNRSNSSLVLTGYQAKRTPGKYLLETGRFVSEGLDVDLKMRMKKFDFSAHLGRKELFKFIEKVNPKKVFCVHGEKTEDFAKELSERGFDAIAPLTNNRTFTIE